MTSQQKLEQNYINLKNEIRSTNRINMIQRNVTLVAVSKTFPAASIRSLFALGQIDFGENYVQEFLAKAEELGDLPFVWHFIGKIQSNKTKYIAQHAHWVHGLDQAKHALRLNKDRPKNMPKLNVLIEVNLSGDSIRHGVVNINEIAELVQVITAQENLIFRGLMGIAGNSSDRQLIADQFKSLHTLYTQIQQLYPNVDTLSMGMSGDYHIALENGATMLRIGSLIFGNRTYLKKC